MQTAVKNDLIFTDFLSLSGLTGLQKQISRTGFYQQIVRELGNGAYTKQLISYSGDRFIALAEHSYALRRRGGQAGKPISYLLPIKQQALEREPYYRALCTGGNRNSIREADKKRIKFLKKINALSSAAATVDSAHRKF